MRNLYCWFACAVIISILVIFLTGCGISFRPRSYDAPPEDDVYYEERNYGSYYDTAPAPRTYYYHDPTYDPWTMGTYYQYYSGPPRADRDSSGSTTGSAQSESKRPAVKARDSASVNQSNAPNKERASLRSDKLGMRERRKVGSEPTSSSINRQEVKRNVRRGTAQAPQRKESTNESREKRRREQAQASSRKTRSESAKPESEESEEEGKE